MTQRKWNVYNLDGDYGIGYTAKGDKFYFDLEDYDLVKCHCWCMLKKGYVVTHCEIDGENKLVHLEQLVMKSKKGETVDHINHNKAFDCKVNLRIVTKSQNGMNQLISISNKSGTKGVFRNVKRQTWIAYIGINGKKISKSFKDKDEAIAYRKYLERKYHGEYALQENLITEIISLPVNV